MIVSLDLLLAASVFVTHEMVALVACARILSGEVPTLGPDIRPDTPPDAHRSVLSESGERTIWLVINVAAALYAGIAYGYLAYKYIYQARHSGARVHAAARKATTFVGFVAFSSLGIVVFGLLCLLDSVRLGHALALQTYLGGLYPTLWYASSIKYKIAARHHHHHDKGAKGETPASGAAGGSKTA
jgi:hypothetical protein